MWLHTWESKKINFLHLLPLQIPHSAFISLSSFLSSVKPLHPFFSHSPTTFHFLLHLTPCDWLIMLTLCKASEIPVKVSTSISADHVYFLKLTLFTCLLIYSSCYLHLFLLDLLFFFNLPFHTFVLSFLVVHFSLSYLY